MRSFSINGHPFSGASSEVLEWIEKRRSYAAEWETSHLNFIQQWFAGPDDFYFTSSGTTGTPKTISFTRSQLIASAQLTARTFDLKPGTVAWLCLPSKFVAGKMMLARACANGWNLTYSEPSSQPFEKNLFRGDLAAFTPMQVQEICRVDAERLNSIRTILVGGGALSPVIEDSLQQVTSRVVATYGMTETLTHVAIRDVNGTNRSEWFNLLDGVSAREDPRGCMVLTLAHLDNLEVITNDLVEWHPDGRFRIKGRIDDAINSGGIKIFPGELEALLSESISQPFFITSEPDERLGERVVLCIEGERWDDNRMERLRSILSDKLEKWQYPGSIRFEAAFLYTSSGKLIRKKK